MPKELPKAAAGKASEGAGGAPGTRDKNVVTPRLRDLFKSLKDFITRKGGLPVKAPGRKRSNPISKAF